MYLLRLAHVSIQNTDVKRTRSRTNTPARNRPSGSRTLLGLRSRMSDIYNSQPGCLSSLGYNRSVDPTLFLMVFCGGSFLLGVDLSPPTVLKVLSWTIYKTIHSPWLCCDSLIILYTLGKILMTTLYPDYSSPGQISLAMSRTNFNLLIIPSWSMALPSR